MNDKKKSPSVAHFSRTITVSASPFNRVKKDLVWLLTGAVLLWLLRERLALSELEHTVILSSYGLLSGLWVSARVWWIARRLRQTAAAPATEDNFG